VGRDAHETDAPDAAATTRRNALVFYICPRAARAAPTASEPTPAENDAMASGWRRRAPTLKFQSAHRRRPRLQQRSHRWIIVRDVSHDTADHDWLR